MSEESDSSDEDLDGIEATSEEGRILQARREEVGGGEGCDGCARTSSLPHLPHRFTFLFLCSPLFLRTVLTICCFPAVAKK